MEIFEPLSKFYDAIDEDPRIGVTHISLYMALLQQWNLNGGTNPIEISRVKLMNAAKISSRFTFYKCLNDLHEFMYINYVPSSSKFMLSVYYLKGLK